MNTYTDDVRLKKLQAAEYKILVAFDELCRQNKLNYYLAYGTLLGCIRHNGFIPWDDDVDVFMPREDYKKLQALSSESLPQNLKICSYSNNRASQRLSFSIKIEDKTKAIIRRYGAQTEKQLIWIDVFPLDGMPQGQIAREFHYLKLQFFQTLFRIARSYNNGIVNEKKRSVKEIIGIKLMQLFPVGKFLSTKRQMEIAEQYFEKYPFENSEYLFGYAPEYGKKRIIKKKWFIGVRKGLFENGMFFIPEGSEELLKHWYGDYMKLPPESERYTKHCEDIVEV